MSEQYTPNVPSGVKAFAAQLGEDCGAEPSIEWLGGHRWHIEVDNGRVRMWVAYEALSRGRLRWAGSELFVNGQKVSRADSYAGFLRIFHDGGELTYDTVEMPTAEAPEMFRRLVAKLTPKLTPDDSLKILRTGPKLMLVYRTNRGVIRVHMVRPFMDPTRPSRKVEAQLRRTRPIEMEIGDRDVTDEVDGRLDRALARMSPNVQSAPPPPAVAGQSDSKTRATSVQVRNTAVIRN